MAYLQMDNMLGMMQQVSELELYLCPNMNVYKNLLSTGLDHALFKSGFIPRVLILEELLYQVMHGKNPSNLTAEQSQGNVCLIRNTENQAN